MYLLGRDGTQYWAKLTYISIFCQFKTRNLWLLLSDSSYDRGRNLFDVKYKLTPARLPSSDSHAFLLWPQAFVGPGARLVAFSFKESSWEIIRNTLNWLCASPCLPATCSPCVQLTVTRQRGAASGRHGHYRGAFPRCGPGVYPAPRGRDWRRWRWRCK